MESALTSHIFLRNSLVSFSWLCDCPTHTIINSLRTFRHGISHIICFTYGNISTYGPLIMGINRLRINWLNCKTWNSVLCIILRKPLSFIMLSSQYIASVSLWLLNGILNRISFVCLPNHRRSCDEVLSIDQISFMGHCTFIVSVSLCFINWRSSVTGFFAFFD